MSIIDLLKSIGIEAATFIAGSSGAVALLAKSKKMSKTQQFFTVLSGGLSANYVTPLVISILGLDSNVGYGVAFILGYSGMKFVESIIQFFISKIHNDSE